MPERCATVMCTRRADRDQPVICTDTQAVVGPICGLIRARWGREWKDLPARTRFHSFPPGRGSVPGAGFAWSRVPDTCRWLDACVPFEAVGGQRARACRP